MANIECFPTLCPTSVTESNTSWPVFFQSNCCAKVSDLRSLQELSPDSNILKSELEALINAKVSLFCIWGWKSIRRSSCFEKGIEDLWFVGRACLEAQPGHPENKAYPSRNRLIICWTCSLHRPTRSPKTDISCTIASAQQQDYAVLVSRSPAPGLARGIQIKKPQTLDNGRLCTFA